MTNALRLERAGAVPPVPPRRPPLTAVPAFDGPDLAAELKALRRGRGILTHDIAQRTGPGLRATAGVHPGDTAVQLRTKVAHLLHRLADNLPDDLRDAALAAFALTPEARHPLYKDRVAHVAARIERDPRTARRRIDEAITHLAQQATAPPTPSGTPTSAPGVGVAGAASWRWTDLRVSVALDRLRPEVLEHGQIRAGRDQLDRHAIVADRILTRPDAAAADPTVDVLHGGVLTGRRGAGPPGRPGAPTPGRPVPATPARPELTPARAGQGDGGRLALGRVVGVGGSADYAVRAVAGGPVRPQAVVQLDQPCEQFVLNIRFDRDRLPRRVRVVGGPGNGTELRPDRAGEVRAEFHRLRPGQSYGLVWGV